MRKHHTVICGLPGSTICIPHYLINGTIFGGKPLFNITCVFTSSESCLILRRIQRNMVKDYVEIKCQLDTTDDIYCRFYCKLNMFRAILCLSSGAREYYTDGRCLWYLVLWFSSCRYGVELRVMMMGRMVPETC